MTRSERQRLCIKRWIEAKGHGTIIASFAFGKTCIATSIIRLMLKKYPDLKTLIVVPTITLKEQWLKNIDDLGLTFNCDVQVINTVITKDWECDLLIIDEIHSVFADTYKQVFTKVKYKKILGLTATLERLDGKHELCKKYCPVCDNVPTTECLINGWISSYKEYLVLIDVDDIEKYQTLSKEFQEHMEFFNYNFDLMKSCTGPKGYIVCDELRNQMCPAKRIGGKIINEQARKDIFKQIKFRSIRGMKLVQERKKFIDNHPKKLELTREIINARPFFKIITFSNSIKMAESIKIGKVYSGKDTKKHSRSTLDEFKSSTSGVLNTIKKAILGLNVPDISVGIILGTDSSKIKAGQKLGRVLRLDESKEQAEVFNLVINNSIELAWFQKSHENQHYTIIDEEGLRAILNGEEPQPYKHAIQNFTYRF